MLYNFLRSLFRLVYATIIPWKVEGLHNIPAEGPLIVCSNHIHWADPTVVASLIKGKKVHFMAKEEIFKYFLFGNIIKRVGAFPVKRDSADLSTIKKSLSLLKDGQFLGMFPEGTRSRTGQVGEALPGVALIALKSKAPVLPVAIKGRYLPFSGVRVKIGSPMTFDEFYEQKARKELLAEVSRSIMAEIRRLHGGI